MGAIVKMNPIAAFEQALGGRGAVMDSIAIDSTPEIQRLVKLLLLPDYDDLSLSELAEQAQISLTDLLRAYRNATLAKAQILAVQRIAARLPELAADVMTRALPQPMMCPVCRGNGSLPSKTAGDNTPILCKTCKATGEVSRPPSVQRQRLALELAEMIRLPKDHVPFFQQNNINLPPSSPVAPGSLEQMQQAVTNLLFKRAPAIDVETIPQAAQEAGEEDQ